MPKTSPPSTNIRERLFNQARRTIPVTLSTGDVVEIRPLSISERNRIAKACLVDGETDMDQLCPTLVIACTFDPETGVALFTLGDRDALGAMDAHEIDPLWTAAAKLNGFAPDAIEHAEKN